MSYSTYTGRQRVLFKQAAVQASSVLPQKQKVRAELEALGVTTWGMLWPENRFLHHILHHDERLEAIVYGHSTEGTALLAATDRRMIFLDKTPFSLKSDELTYDIVGGIKYGQSGLFASVTLHTRIKDYKIRTMNLRCAVHFREFIESRCLEHNYNRYAPNNQW